MRSATKAQFVIIVVAYAALLLILATLAAPLPAIAADHLAQPVPENSPHLASHMGTLEAGAPQAVAVPVARATAVGFMIMANGPVEAALRSPTGERIDASSPATNPLVQYNAVEGDPSDEWGVWYHLYNIEQPAGGVWQVELSAAERTEYAFRVTAATPVRLILQSEERVYEPEATIAIEAAAIDGNRLMPGFSYTGTVQFDLSEEPAPLVFYDDGAHGDRRSGDGIAVAQFVAPAQNADIDVSVRAVNGDIVRLEETLVYVVRKSAAILGVGGEQPVDTNDNGYFDELHLDVTVDILAEGDFSISGTLVDAAGTMLDSDVYASRDHGLFAAGVHTVTLRFDGKTLRESGSDGPYLLDYLRVEENGTESYLAPVVASRQRAYTTAPYTTRQFEGEALAPGTATDAAVDLNGNGLYDQLVISATLDVLEPGIYDWMGILVDPDGEMVAQVAGEGWLDAETPAAFVVTGGLLRRSERDGPYRLTEVFIFPNFGIPNSTFLSNLHTTEAYRYTAFDRTPVAFKRVEQATGDLDGNGLIDRLAISVTVAAVDREGDYDWRGRLVAADGREVAATTGKGQLYPGKVFAFTFDGPAVRTAGLKGPYELRDVTITSRSGPTLSAEFPLLYTTTGLELSRFDPEAVAVAADSRATDRRYQGDRPQVISARDHAVDADGDGLYENLAISVKFYIPLPGYYVWEGTLVDGGGEEVARTSGEGELDDSRPAILVFTGERIFRSDVDGPYMLTDVTITGPTAHRHAYEFADVHTTAPHTSAEFGASK